VGRLKAKEAARVALFISRAGNRDKHIKITPGITLTWLAALDAGKSLEGYL
jgi:hypothetical protein